MAGIGQLDDGEDEGEDDSLMEVADEGTRVVTNSTDFRVGQTFETNDDLSKKISEYERAHFVQLWKRDTKTVEAAQKMLSRTLSSRIKYYVLTYACIHGGRKFKARGEGKRSTQTFQKECPFELKLRASVDGNFLEVRDFNESHNHEITRELFKQLPTQRKLSAQEQASARHLLSLKANKKMVQDNLSADTGKVVLLKDLSNIMRRDTSDTRNNLNQTVKLLTEKFGASVELLLGENNVLFGVYFQDVQMKNILNSYPEVVCVDATYKLLELRFPVYIMLIEDGNGQSEIVAVFLLQEETEESISSVIDMFIRQNPASSKVRIIITDKDMTERDVLARKFPSAQLLICLFHTLRTFRREVTLEKMGITPGQRNLYLDLMQQMAYAASEEKYLEVYERFKDSAVPLLALKGKVSLKTTDLSLEANDTNQIYEVTCSSGVTLNVSLPCRHILAVRDKVKIDLYSEELCDKRWQISYYKSCQRAYTADSNDGGAESPGCVNSVCISSKKKRILSQSEKFRRVSKLTTKLAFLASEDSGHRFNDRCEVLKFIATEWENGRGVRVEKAEKDEVESCILNSDENDVLDYGQSDEEMQVHHEDENCVIDELPHPKKAPKIGIIGDSSIDDFLSQELFASDSIAPIDIASQLPEPATDKLPSTAPVVSISIKEKVMLKWFVDEQIVDKALKDSSILIDESEVEVRPEKLPDALRDENVEVHLIRKFFTEDAWLLVKQACE
uniref:Uncharacterized protein n=1 Tax=Amphimedon queenslandica TaxID=400682 RepID=A0A1X7TS70_AMPQE